MRHAAALCQWHLCRRNLNALIDLDGITVDDLAADASRQFDSQLTFS
jgi:hypothetical protein